MNYCFIAFTFCGRLLIQRVSWRMCNWQRILSAFDSVGIGPVDVQIADVGSICSGLVSTQVDLRLFIVERVSELTHLIILGCSGLSSILRKVVPTTSNLVDILHKECFSGAIWPFRSGNHCSKVGGSLRYYADRKGLRPPWQSGD